MKHTGCDRSICVMCLQRLGDVAVIFQKIWQSLLFLSTENAKAVNLGLLLLDHFKGVLFLGDSTDRLVKIEVQFAKGRDIPTGNSRVLKNQGGIELGRTGRIAKLGSEAYDFLFDASPNEARLLDLLCGKAPDFCRTLRSDQQQVKIGKTAEGIAHRLPGNAKLRSYFGFRNAISGLQFQRNDLLVKMIENVIHTCTSSAS